MHSCTVWSGRAQSTFVDMMSATFVAGDVRAQLTRQITTAVGDATTAVIAAEKYLTDLKEERAAAAQQAG